jgi:N-acyl amino acid synthase of PEP-CTERM/exosortase system
MRSNPNTGLARLWGNFERFFELSLATTDSERRAVYRFRYRIFCEELGFVDPQRLPESCEMDCFDEYSIHCYVTHRESGTIVGCVRLVTADTSTELPMERRCREALYPATLRHVRNRRSHIAEVSRLAVSHPSAGLYRASEAGRRAGKPKVISREEQQTFPLIAVSLMAAAGACAGQLRRTECFAMMERSLLARLRRVGIPATRVGEDIEYVGAVAPYLLEVEEAVCALPQNLRLIYEDVNIQVAASMRTAGMQSRPAGVRAAHGDAIATGLERSLANASTG